MSKTSRWVLIWCTVAVLLSAVAYRWYDYQHSLAGLYISSNVAAGVWLNNRLVGSTPFLDEQLAAGTHLLRIVPENDFYLPLETLIVLESGYLSVVSWQWQKETGKSFGLIYEMSEATGSAVSISSTPDRALIYWQNEGQPLFAPTTIADVLPGAYQFTLTLPGFDNLSGMLEIGEKQQIMITAVLGSGTNGGQFESNGDLGGEEAETSESDEQAPSLARILPTNYFEEGIEVLRVRDEPHANATQVGVVNVGDTVPYLGETRAGWYRIMFRGQSGWISSDFSELR
jgi:hypothetical protein